MPHHLRVGEVRRHEHTGHGSPGGRRHGQEPIGAEGFAADSSLLHHRYPPTALPAVMDHVGVRRLPSGHVALLGE